MKIIFYIKKASVKMPSKSRSYRRLPRSMTIDEEYFPKWDVSYDILNSPENVQDLMATFARLYQQLHWVTLNGPFCTPSNRLYTLICVSSTNPKTQELWYDQWRVYEDGSMACRLGKKSSWRWRYSYLKKSKRVISTWLYNIIHKYEQNRIQSLLVSLINTREVLPSAWDIYDLLKDSPHVRYYVKQLPVP
jgi:hypothetical protein